jgi:hypothetical protein
LNKKLLENFCHLFLLNKKIVKKNCKKIQNCRLFYQLMQIYICKQFELLLML